MTTFTYDENTFSDLHKDTYGFRPRNHRFYDAPPEEKQEIWNFLCEELKQEQEETKKKIDKLNLNECWVCDGQGGSQTEECLHCKGTGDLAKGTPEAISEVQTWPWDTIILMNPRETGKDLTIPGTDIEVIYDREAKVYRRK